MSITNGMYLIHAPTPVRFILALSVDVLVLAILFPALHAKSRTRKIVLPLLALATLLSPCVVPSNQPVLRLFIALCVSAIQLKIFDLGREAAAGRIPSLKFYLSFVTNIYWYVVRRPPAARPGNTRLNWWLLTINAIALSIALPAAIVVFHVDWARLPFAAEHIAKLFASYAVVASLLNGTSALWRIIGFPTVNGMNHPELARTPADFWRRWNLPTAQFLHEDVFLPAGGMRHPVRATLVVFAFSAIYHEYVFDIAIGRVQGYQMCFFAIQALAAVATLRMRPTGWRRIPCILLTLTFNLITARLFVASVAEILPCYVPRGHS